MSPAVSASVDHFHLSPSILSIGWNELAERDVMRHAHVRTYVLYYIASKLEPHRIFAQQ